MDLKSRRSLAARVCFNASPVTAHPTEAQLYRSAAPTGGVQLFDEVEVTTPPRSKPTFCASMRSSPPRRVRLEKRGERFEEEPYGVYAPRSRSEKLPGVGYILTVSAARHK